LDKGLFEGYDVRGIYGKDLTEGDAKSIGRAFGTLFKPGDNIVVGGDARTHTPPLKDAFIGGLVSSGVNVVDVGLVPTHVVTFEVLRRNASGGAVITASHNPAEYNGIKMYLGDVPLSSKQMALVGDAALNGKFRGSGKGVMVAEAAGEYYSDAVSQACRFGKTLRVVIDAGNGACGPDARKIFARLDCDFEVLFEEPDGHFPNHAADPHKEATLDSLKKRVVESKADLGVALDGDGDRVAFVDENGVKVRSDDALIFLLRHYLSRVKGGSVAYDLRMSNAVPDEVKRLGGVPVLSAAGRTNVGEAARKSGALVAGEQTGHTFCGDFYYHDDALFAAAKFCQVLSLSSRTLSQEVALIPRYVASPELRLKVPADKKREIVALVVAYIKSEAPKLGGKVLEIDGIRADFPDGSWGLVRVSNTEPAITCRFEAHDATGLRKVYALFRGKLLELGVDAPASF